MTGKNRKRKNESREKVNNTSCDIVSERETREGREREKSQRRKVTTIRT